MNAAYFAGAPHAAGVNKLVPRIHIDFSLTGYTWPVSDSPAIAEA